MDLEQQQKVLKTFRPRNIALAIIFGLGVTGYMLYSSITEGEDFFKNLSDPNWFWAACILLTLFARDLGYMYRIKNITNQELSWKASFFVIFLWEFASAVTPSVVGGTLVAVFILNREGINTGKAVAYAMFTAILDNCYFLVVSPIVLSITGWDIVPNFDYGWINKDILLWAFKISYLLIGMYTSFMIFGIFIKPKFFKNFLFGFVKIFRLKSKYKRRVINFGNEIRIASIELKDKSFGYWAKAVGSSAFVWSARYFVLNCVFAAFLANSPTKYDNFSHKGTWSKQVIMWVTQLVSPTPGASGAAEGMVNAMYDGTINPALTIDKKPVPDTLGIMGPPDANRQLVSSSNEVRKAYPNGRFADSSFNSAVAFVWRLVTFYPYLILGAFLLPRWLRRVFVKTGEDIKAKAKEQKKPEKS